MANPEKGEKKQSTYKDVNEFEEFNKEGMPIALL